MTAVIFDASNLLNVTLASGDLSAQNTATSNPSGCKGEAATAKSSGLLYFEIFGLDGSGGSQMSVGCGDPSASYANQISTGGGGGGFQVYQGGSGAVYVSGSSPGSMGKTTAFNDVVAIAVDFTHLKMWVKNVTQSGNWNNSGTADPATNTGGFSFTSTSLVPYFGWGGGGSTGQPMYANFRGGFVGTLPSGFSAWDATGAVTPSTGAWDSAHISSHAFLSSAKHLVATDGTGSAGNEGVLGKLSNSTGKRYLEYSQMNTGGNSFGAGFAPSTLTLGSNPEFYASSQFIKLPSGSSFTPAAMTNASLLLTDVVAFAIDFTVSPARGYVNYNGTGWFGTTGIAGGADPVAGTGGYDLTGLSTPCFPAGRFQFGPNRQAYLNCGDETFAHTLPTGYTAWDGSTPGGIGGTWASTETTDIAGFIGYSGAPGENGSLNATEARDVFAAVGYPAAVGFLFATEARDVFSAFVTQPKTGTWASTEAKDRFNAAGVGWGEDGVFITTEAPDVFAAVGNTPIAGVWASTEVPDQFRAFSTGVITIQKRRVFFVT